MCLYKTCWALVVPTIYNKLGPPQYTNGHHNTIGEVVFFVVVIKQTLISFLIEKNSGTL